MDSRPLILRKLGLHDEATFLLASRSWTENPQFVFAFGFEQGMTFAEYLELLSKWEKGQDLPQGYVPATFLGGFVGDEMVGRISLRHELNEFLFRVGGHVGYGVLPAFRRRGYATAMLAQSLPVAAGLGISKVLVTCDDDNFGSIKTIENCGGILENKVETAPGKLPLKRRYWIEL